MTPEEVIRELEKQISEGPAGKISEPIFYTPRVKVALALAAKEARKLKHTYVGTEHILLGLMREGGGVAEYDIMSEFMEIEREDGQTIFINRALILKFCEHRQKQTGA